MPVLTSVLQCADAQGEGGRMWTVEELQWLSGGRWRPLWLVYAGEQVRNTHTVCFGFLFALGPLSTTVLLCLVVYPCQPSLLPPAKHIIKSNYHVLQCHTRPHMYFNGMMWKVLRAVYLGSDPSAAVYVSDGFVLTLIFKHERSDWWRRKMISTFLSIWLKKTKDKHWDLFPSFHRLCSPFQMSPI